MDTIRELFARHGLRCTRQRELIYEALMQCASHPTAEELFQMASARGATADTTTCQCDNGEPLSLATVYNTIDAFVCSGLARKMACPCGPARFDADMAEHAHVATSDGRIMDLPHDLSARLLEQVPPSLLAEIERRLGVRVAGVSVQVIAARPAGG